MSPSRELAPSDMSDLVWDWPLRLWHWTLALFVFIAWFTPNKYDSLHRFAGYVVIGLLVFRVSWGFVGTRHSRFRTLSPINRLARRVAWLLEDTWGSILPVLQ